MKAIQRKEEKRNKIRIKKNHFIVRLYSEVIQENVVCMLMNDSASSLFFVTVFLV